MCGEKAGRMKLEKSGRCMTKEGEKKAKEGRRGEEGEGRKKTRCRNMQEYA